MSRHRSRDTPQSRHYSTTMTTAAVSGPRATTRQIHNAARGLTEQYMSRRHRAEYLAIRKEVRRLNPQVTVGAIRARSFKILRHRHRLEWARAWTRALQIKQTELGYSDGRVNNGHPAKSRPEYVKPCPTCRAPTGQPCRQGTGRVALPAHKARFIAASQPYPSKKR